MEPQGPGTMTNNTRCHSETAGRNSRSISLTVEESIEVLIAIKIKSRVFTARTVCFRRKAHLEKDSWGKE